MNEEIPVIRLRNKSGDLEVRDGVVLCFFVRRSHGTISQAVWSAVQAYRRAIPSQALGWYVTPDGDMAPLDDKGWEHLHWEIIERPRGAACHVSLSENPGEAGGYHFDYDGRELDHPMFSHDSDATSGMSFTFPTEYLLEHGPAHLRALALEIARELPFSFGYASLAYVSHPGAWFAVRREMLGMLSRYQGLDLYHLVETSRIIGTRARGAYWLTFLGQPLIDQLGGVERLRDRLRFSEVSLFPLGEERLLITLSEWPDVIDTAKDPHVPQYRALARLLEPFLYEERGEWPPVDRVFMHRWLRRLCQ